MQDGGLFDTSSGDGVARPGTAIAATNHQQTGVLVGATVLAMIARVRAEDPMSVRCLGRGREAVPVLLLHRHLPPRMSGRASPRARLLTSTMRSSTRC